MSEVAATVPTVTYADRHLSVPGVIAVGGRQIKRYHVNVEPTEIETAIQDAAYAFLPQLLPALDETPGAAFTIVHRGSAGAFIDAFTWVWDNVIECHTAAAGVPSIGCPDYDVTHFAPLARPWIGCVWELAPFEHERAAWVRHLLATDTPDLDAYLTDSFAAGAVGLARMT